MSTTSPAREALHNPLGIAIAIGIAIEVGPLRGPGIRTKERSIPKAIPIAIASNTVSRRSVPRFPHQALAVHR